MTTIFFLMFYRLTITNLVTMRLLVTRMCVPIIKNDAQKINKQIVCSVVVAQYGLQRSSVQKWPVLLQVI
jgi:hypothetical protein